MNDLLVKEIHSWGGGWGICVHALYCVKLELDPVFNFCLQSLIALCFYEVLPYLTSNGNTNFTFPLTEHIISNIYLVLLY